MNKEAKKKMAKLDQKIADQIEAGSAIPKLISSRCVKIKDKLKEAIETYNQIRDRAGNVQANIGGEKEEGKFRTR